MKKLILTMLLAALSGTVNAGEQEGKVVSIVARGDGLHYFRLSGESSGRPSCYNSNFNVWVIEDETSDLGKAQFSMVVASYTSGGTIKVIGTGSCSRWPDAEDINYVVLK